MSTANAKEIALTILAQLGGISKLTAMIGAKHLVFDTDGSVQFKFTGSRTWNTVKISLDVDTDSYTVQFHKVTMGANYNVKSGEPTHLVFADALPQLFEIETQLRLSL